MRRVVTHLEWRSQLEARLPPLAARFTPDHQAREYLRVYEEAAGRRGTAR
jgi:hypothetical protein